MDSTQFSPYPTSTSRGWSYPGITAINPPTNAFSAGSYYVPQSNSNPYLAASSSTYTFPNASVSSSSSLSASNPFQRTFPGAMMKISLYLFSLPLQPFADLIIGTLPFFRSRIGSDPLSSAQVSMN